MRDLDVASLFFSVLGLVALAGIVLAVPVLVVGRFSSSAAKARDQLVEVVGPVALHLALLVAVTATAGSLWFSEVVGLQPCTLCWWQRAFIYPQVLVLGAALLFPNAARRLGYLSLLLAGIALSISSYHYLLELFPEQLDTGACSASVPCSLVWFRRFGFLTLPALAWCTSASIAWLTIVAGRAVASGDEVSSLTGNSGGRS